MTRPGWIVVLNGAPRSGKSTIARAMQDRLDGHWINFGVDAYMSMVPEKLLPAIGLRPGGERPDLEPIIPVLYAALYDSIAAHARMGLNVVADVGHHDSYTQPLKILGDCARRLNGLPARLIGVDCPIETIMARRAVDPTDSRYIAPGDPVPDPVQRWQDAVHNPGIYDLRIDTSHYTPEASAEMIANLLTKPPKSRTAFAQLATM